MKFVISVFLMIGASATVFASPDTLQIGDGFRRTGIKEFTSCYVQPIASDSFLTSPWYIQKILHAGPALQFDPFQSKGENWYFNNLAAIYWLKFTIHNNSLHSRELVFQLSNTSVVRSQLFTVGTKGIDSSIITGNQFEFNKRPIQRNDYSFVVKLEPGEYKTCFFPFTNCLFTNFEGLFFLWDRSYFDAQSARFNYMVGFGFGMIVIYGIISLLITLFIRSRMNFLFTLYIFNLMILFAAQYDLFFMYLWPGQPFLNIIFAMHGTTFNIILIALMMKSFFETKNNLPIINRVLNIFICAMILAAFLPWLEIFIQKPIHYLSEKIIDNLYLPFALTLFFVGMLSKRRSLTESIFFMGYLSIMISVFLLPVLNHYSITNIDKEFLDFLPLPMFCLEAILFFGFFSYRLYRIYCDNIRIKLEMNNLEAAIVIKEKDLQMETMIATQESERKRISRDLHDDVGTRLTALKMNIATIEEKLVYSDPETEDLLQDSQKMIDETLSGVRKMIANLTPALLQQFGLIAAVENLITKINRTKIVKIEFSRFGLPVTFEQDYELVLYRIVQELLNNALKHAHASIISLQLGFREGNIMVMIEDNGRGFDVNAEVKGYGLSNLLTRTAILKGVLLIDSEPGRGTIVTVEIPLPEKHFKYEESVS